MAWESKSDREGLIAYGKSDDAPVYRNVTGIIINGTESLTEDPNPGIGNPNWISLKSDPQTDDIMMIYLANDGFDIDDIGVELWNGSDWGHEHNAETVSTQANGQRFDLAYTDTSGYLNSTPYYTKYIGPWGRVKWNSDEPLGTSIKLRTRTSFDGSDWSPWSEWYENGDRITGPKNRSIQYQALLETTNLSLTPILYNVSIELNRADLIINGTPGESFGWSVASAGDMDNDNLDDVIIGAPKNNSARGSAYIFYGAFIVPESAGDGFINLTDGDTADVTLSGEASGDLFGYSVSSAGDFNDDGYLDMVVGAPQSSANGTIYVFFGALSMAPQILAADTNFKVVGENVTDGLGWSVGWAGNVDNDPSGYHEIIAGSPYFDDSLNSDAGKVYLFHLYNQPDLWINGSLDEWYQDAPSGAQVNLTYISAGDNATWWLVVENDGELNDTFDFIITYNMLLGWDWELRENQTWNKINDGDNISLSVGESRNYTLNISSINTSVHNDESWVTISVVSQNDTSKKDSVRAIARAIDISPPDILNTTPGMPTTGDLFTITATITDNILVDEPHLYYWFELEDAGTYGPFNVTMDPGYMKEISTPDDAIRLHYNISSNDTSNNWNHTDVISIDVQDDDAPTIQDTTVGTPNASESFTITALVDDNINVSEVRLYYLFDILGPGVDGPYNDTMDPGFSKEIVVPANAVRLYYNISANDTSNRWNESGQKIIDVHEKGKPDLSDTTTGEPTTGDPFVLTATSSDIFDVDKVYLYYWFNTTSGPTQPLNVSMNDLGGDNYELQLDVPLDAFELHYNISTNDTSNNWNETGVKTLDVRDDDLPLISNITIYPIIKEIGDLVNITVNVTDNIELDEVWIKIELANGSIINESMEKAAGDIWYYERSYIEAGNYNYTIWANDSSDNPNQSTQKQFTILTPPPTVDDIKIRSGPNEGGVVITSKIYDLGDTDVYHAAGYNRSYGYIGDVEVGWSSTDSSGSVNPSLGLRTNFTAVSVGEGTIFAVYALGIQNSTTFEVRYSQEPELIDTIPDIPLSEDFGIYHIDLSPYASHPQGLSVLKWYLTGVDRSIINVMGENVTGKNLISFVSQNNRYGNMEVTYWLVYDDENKVSQRAWINVSPVNDPPTIGDCPTELIVRYDTPYSFDFTPYINDIDNTLSELTLTCEDTAPITVSGFVVTFNYPQNMLGDQEYVTLRVSDGDLEGSKLINILITSDYPPEIIEQLQDVDLYENETKLAHFDLSRNFKDPEGERLIFTVLGNKNVGITINSDNTVDFKASEEWSGTEMITFRASDVVGGIAEQTIIVRVIPVNDPPIIHPIDNIQVHYDHNYTFDLFWYISDKDNAIEELTITTSHPDNVRVNGSQIILLYPEYWEGERYPYTVPLTIYVSDGIYNVSRTLNVMVSDNFPPYILNSLDDLFLLEDEELIGAYDLDEYFYDIDGDTLFYTYGNKSIAVTIHDNHTIDFVPPPDWYGSELILIRAIDVDGAFLEDVIIVTVLPVNDPPTIEAIPPQTVEHSREWILDLTEYLSDIDNDLDSLIVSVNSSYVQVIGHALVFNYPDNITEDIIWITVSDGELETTIPVEITVVSPSAPPSEVPWIWYLITLILVGLLSVVLLTRIARYTLIELFLISKAGMLIEHAGIYKKDDKDKDILASMFVAVQSFIKDAFAEEDTEVLKRMDYGKKTVLIHMGNHVLLTAFIAGQESKSFLKEMKDFIDTLEQKYEGAIEQWDGNYENLPGIEKMLQDFFDKTHKKTFFKKKVAIEESSEDVLEKEFEKEAEEASVVEPVEGLGGYLKGDLDEDQEEDFEEDLEGGSEEGLDDWLDEEKEEGHEEGPEEDQEEDFEEDLEEGPEEGPEEGLDDWLEEEHEEGLEEDQEEDFEEDLEEGPEEGLDDWLEEENEEE
ncbi:MAG: FG-GAP repeat protein [Methanomassiliicoccales archaeon]|nr:MAG: FG-GAP repeat protein [Methanomassiliicoccales archaeon]